MNSNTENIQETTGHRESAKTRKNYLLMVMFFCLFVYASEASAQHVGFGKWAKDDIVLLNGTPRDLNFNDKTPVIRPGVSQSVTISLTDPEAAVLTIEGTEYLDVTVYIDPPVTLDLDGSNKIPVSIRFAYSNLNAADVATAKTQAIEVPAGFNTATFPIVRRINGPPGPPPTPPSSGVCAAQENSLSFYIWHFGAGTQY